MENTATQKLISSVNEMLEYRQEMFEISLGLYFMSFSFYLMCYYKLQKEHSCGKTLGDVVSLNLTMLQAGVTQDHKVYLLLCKQKLLVTLC